MRFLAGVVLLTFIGVSDSNAQSTASGTEIDRLFSYLGTSDCQFNRNGEWYSAETAVDHLRNKYNYLLGKGLITTAESFIERVATRSSMSGATYLVRCNGSGTVESGEWLLAELARMRME